MSGERNHAHWRLATAKGGGRLHDGWMDGSQPLSDSKSILVGLKGQTRRQGPPRRVAQCGRTWAPRGQSGEGEISALVAVCPGDRVEWDERRVSLSGLRGRKAGVARSKKLAIGQIFGHTEQSCSSYHAVTSCPPTPPARVSKSARRPSPSASALTHARTRSPSSRHPPRTRRAFS